MVSLEWYRSFLAVYRMGTVSAAAKSIFLTQPAVSQHLQALEHALGTGLFLRTARRMVPTERAKELYADIVQAMERLESAGRKRKAEVTEPPLVTLGSPLEIFQERLARGLTGLEARVWVRFGATGELVEALQ